ncbi:restriction endonuclease subunit S [Psychrobacter sp. DD43]|uniref:restriction endonuclease subunit S n=1 Tax=Psychrobacter sp. DD43 TaxID=2774128 RepID=UPI00191B0CEB|nr:restriction endonuclease subunit S [Psychrobacter sp. DD43]
MASDWKFCKIGDVAKIQGGYAFKSKDFSDTGTPVIKIKNVRKRDIDLTDVARVSQEVAEQASSFLVKSWDVLISMTGSGPNAPASIVGRVARHSGEDDVFLINQRVGRFLIKEKEQLDQRFLYYLFSEDKTQLELLSIATGSANQVNISGKQIESIEVNLPPLSEQKAIAHVLGSLDDKIELNRQMNETLEAMAQALFKSWFVDFDPVIDNVLAAGNAIPDELLERAEQRQATEKKDDSDIQSLFPDEFEFTEEMGWIPKGWASGTIAGISFVKGGYAFKSKDFTDTGFPVIKIKNINSDRTVNTSDVQFIPNEIAKKAESFWLKTGDLMMAMTGATVGKFGLLVAENKKAYLLNQRVAKFSPISSVSDKIWFIYCFLNQKSTIDYIVNIAEGSAQPNISADSIMATQLVKPSNELINIFNETVDSNLNKMLMNREECLTLEKLRDTLLPKLISGELRIQDAEALVDEVL